VPPKGGVQRRGLRGHPPWHVPWLHKTLPEAIVFANMAVVPVLVLLRCCALAFDGIRLIKIVYSCYLSCS
jgi:hypothetical protein